MDKGWVDIFFRHPNIDLTYLEKALGLPQRHGWVAGQSRIAKSGRLLPIKDYHYWASGITFSQERGFITDVQKMLDLLCKQEVQLAELISTGGKVTLSLHFQGVINNGDILVAEQLRRIGEMGIDLGMEVFPTIQNDRKS